MQKSQPAFSSDIQTELATRLSGRCGIPITHAFCMYLGMHLLQKKVDKDTYCNV